MSRDYSKQSAKNPCQACPAGRQKIIYLTFDDGPEPGTISIYNKLKELGIPATFFFVGENVIAHESGEFEKIGITMTPQPGLFKQIFDDPLFQIGNHSQTQSHQFYQSYYETGLRIDPITKKPSAISALSGRRSVLVDFEFANLAFTHALNGTSDQYIADMQKFNNYTYRGSNVSGEFRKSGITHFRFLAARMPGTNRWRVPGNNDTAWEWTDRDDEADDLKNNGYLVYGWDLEWEMSNDTSVMSKEVREEHLNNEDGWWDGYYKKSNKKDDHLDQSVNSMFSEIESELDLFWDGTRFESTEDTKAIILLHDRQFRPDSNTSNPYIDSLEKLIKKCQAKGYQFDVLENY